MCVCSALGGEVTVNFSKWMAVLLTCIMICKNLKRPESVIGPSLIVGRIEYSNKTLRRYKNSNIVPECIATNSPGSPFKLRGCRCQSGHALQPDRRRNLA